MRVPSFAPFLSPPPPSQSWPHPCSPALLSFLLLLPFPLTPTRHPGPGSTGRWVEWKGKIRSKVPEWAGRAHPPLVCSCSPSSCPSLSLQPSALVVRGAGWSGEERHGARCKSGLVVVVTMAGLWLWLRLRLMIVRVGRGYLRDVCIRARCWKRWRTVLWYYYVQHPFCALSPPSASAGGGFSLPLQLARGQ